MLISKRTKLILFILTILLNTILRFQVVQNEIGVDSFLIHIMTNSISEFGYAQWISNVLSIFGLSPYSYTSSVPFLLSGIYQVTNINMEDVIFIYCLFLGIFSIFTAYVMASIINKDDLFKILVAFSFSLSPAVLAYTTMTIPTRGLLIIASPLIFLLMSKYLITEKLKYILILTGLTIFLFSTHHLFYFLIPVFVSFLIITICFKLKKRYILLKFPDKFLPILILAGFCLMLFIPMGLGKFLEQSRYSALLVITSYMRYVGIIMIFAFGGLLYTVFKPHKNFGEWILILSTMFLTALIFKETYMKNFIQILLIPMAFIGFFNLMKVLNSSSSKKPATVLIIILLLGSVSFCSYYQFIHYKDISWRYIPDSTIVTGLWLKENANGSIISNSNSDGNRLFAFSDTTHFLLDDTIIDATYGFLSPDISKFKPYPITTEDFWLDVGTGPAFGENAWQYVHTLDHTTPADYNLSYFVENINYMGKYAWHHGTHTSKLLTFVHQDGAIVYDSGKLKTWMT